MDITNYVNQLKNLEKQYQPNEDIAESLSVRTVVPIIGATAVGKNAVMQTITKRDIDFSYVRGFTTRDPRGEENNYRFLPYNIKTLQDLLKKARHGELVQFAVHPTTGHVYGSEIEDYPNQYNLLDMLYSSIDTLRTLPFGRHVEIAMVSPAEEWQTRFKERWADDPEEQKRLEEARQSLEWCLSQPYMRWVVNDDGQQKRTAKDIIDLAHFAEEFQHEIPPSEARDMLSVIEAMIADKQAVETG